MDPFWRYGYHDLRVVPVCVVRLELAMIHRLSARATKSFPQASMRFKGDFLMVKKVVSVEWKFYVAQQDINAFEQLI